MKLFHTTLKKNLPSIRKHGLLVVKSQGKLPAIWLHAAYKTQWAFLHTVRKHGGRIEDVVTIEVGIPKGETRRSAVPGLFSTLQDIDPTLLGGETSFRQVSASPLENHDEP